MLLTLLLKVPSSSSSHFSYAKHTSFSDSLISTSGAFSSFQCDQQSMGGEDLTLEQSSG